MQTEIKRIEKQVKIAIERCQINHIVCVNYEFIRNKTSLKQANELLNTQKDYKINADLLHFFNELHDLQSKVVKDNLSEENAIETQIQETIQNLEERSTIITKEKKYNFELNNCFVKLIDQIDKAIREMHYHHWLGAKNPNVNENILYILLKHKHATFTKFKINLDTTKGQRDQLAKAFIFRQEKLKDLKATILEIYAKKIYSRLLKAIPEFEYSCSKVDICELAYSLELSNTSFNDSGLVAITLLTMFKISKTDYSKAKGEIRKRVKDKNVFLKKLGNKIEVLKTPKKNKI